MRWVREGRRDTRSPRAGTPSSSAHTSLRSLGGLACSHVKQQAALHCSSQRREAGAWQPRRGLPLSLGAGLHQKAQKHAGVHLHNGRCAWVPTRWKGAGGGHAGARVWRTWTWTWHRLESPPATGKRSVVASVCWRAPLCSSSRPPAPIPCASSVSKVTSPSPPSPRLLVGIAAPAAGDAGGWSESTAAQRARGRSGGGGGPSRAQLCKAHTPASQLCLPGCPLHARTCSQLAQQGQQLQRRAPLAAARRCQLQPTKLCLPLLPLLCQVYEQPQAATACGLGWNSHGMTSGRGRTMASASGHPDPDTNSGARPAASPPELIHPLYQLGSAVRAT